MQVDVLVRLGPGSGSLHRLIAILARKRATIDALSFESGASTSLARLRLQLDGDRLSHLLAAIQRDITVLDATVENVQRPR